MMVLPRLGISCPCEEVLYCGKLHCTETSDENQASGGSTKEMVAGETTKRVCLCGEVKYTSMRE